MTSLQDFAFTASSRYIQSVVFVDDEIYVPDTGKANPEVKLTTEMKVFGGKKEEKKEEKSAAKTSTDVSETPTFHPKQLVKSFAKHRVVCALYEPSQGFGTDPDSEIFKLCERADVVILDWDLYNEDGRNILPLIANLVNQSQTTVPHHVRLCAIYSTKPDLFRISSTIFETLEKQGLKVEALADNSLVAGSSRIVVLGKPSAGRAAEQVKLAEVKEADLAERIITEFASMHEGILPSLALHGMAAVRNNAKKILDKFSADMDGAFLVHRALIHPADDAFEQIPELLAEEALSVMVDNEVPPEKTRKLSEDLIDLRNIQLQWTAKDGRPAAQPGQIAIALMKGGQPAVKQDFRGDKQKNWVAELHAAMADGAIATEMRLATLYSVRTKYADRRDLSFGTIVRQKDGEDYVYLACLMPLCDCVRLQHDKSYDFPFWVLKPSNSGASARGVVVQKPGTEEYLELFVLGKPRDRFVMRSFKAGTRGTVEAVEKEGVFLLDGYAGPYEWVAQLKPSHAQRIAQDVGASFSRVGLIEAEWLRKKSEKSGDD